MGLTADRRLSCSVEKKKVMCGEIKKKHSQTVSRIMFAFRIKNVSDSVYL